MDYLDYSYVNATCDTPLDSLRLNLMLQDIIVEIEAAPRGTKVKTPFSIESKSSALKFFRDDLETTRKNLHYWLFTREGLQRIQEEPEFVNQFFSRHHNHFRRQR